MSRRGSYLGGSTILGAWSSWFKASGTSSDACSERPISEESRARRAALLEKERRQAKQTRENKQVNQGLEKARKARARHVEKAARKLAEKAGGAPQGERASPAPVMSKADIQRMKAAKRMEQVQVVRREHRGPKLGPDGKPFKPGRLPPKSE